MISLFFLDQKSIYNCMEDNHSKRQKTKNKNKTSGVSRMAYPGGQTENEFLAPLGKLKNGAPRQGGGG